MKNERWFSALYLLASAGTLLCALLVNFLGNSTNLFPSPLHPAMSERAWKTRRLDEAVAGSRAPRAFILGDSRVMQIQPAYVRALRGETTFNYGVSVATPTDFLAQLRYLLKIGCRPDLIIVGVDENTLISFDRPNQVGILGHVGLFSEVACPNNLRIIGRAVSLCGPSTTRDSLLRLLQPQPSKRNVATVGNILLDDGYLIYCDKAREIHAGTFNLSKMIREGIEEAKQYAQSGGPGKVHLDSERLRQFEEFLALARENRSEVKVILLPLQPDWEKRMFTREMRQGRRELKRYLDDTCTTLGATYRDFTDLRAYDGDPKEFYDGFHQTCNNTRRMMNVLFGLAPRSTIAQIPADADILDHLPAVTTLTTD